MRRLGIFIFLVAGVGLVAGIHSPSKADLLGAKAQTIAIPSYFYPGGPGQTLWDQLEAAYPTVGLAIINPGIYILEDPRIDPKPRANYSDVNYGSQVASSQAAGLQILGYVPNTYGARDIFLVKDDIDLFYDLFNVDGIFLDEVSTDCADIQYYEVLYEYIKAKGGAAVTVLNPGTQTDECYMLAGDVIVNFEGFYEDPGVPDPGQWYKDNYLAPSWVSKYPPSRFWHLVHTTGTVDKMKNAILLSKDRNAGWVYVTPDVMPNPWDTLPTDPYWSEELTTVQPLVKPPACFCVGPFQGLLAWWRGNDDANDAVGSNDGTIQMDPGSPFFPYSVGKVGRAFSLGFGGFSDSISFGTGPSITGTGPFTVAAWVATTDAEGVIVQQRDGGFDGQYILSVGGMDPLAGFASDPGKVCWTTFGNGDFGFNFCSTQGVTDGLFHHIVAVREADGTGKIYVDGVLDSTQGSPARTLVPLGVFVGADMRDNARFLRGIIDEVQIYTRALPAGEVQAILLPPVGGIAELPDIDEAPLHNEAQARDGTALVAGVAAAITAGAVALVLAAWYVRWREEG